MLYVIKTNLPKKTISKFFKDLDYSVEVLNFNALFSEARKKNKKLTEEMFSTNFDTLLTSTKKDTGLKDCMFIRSEDDITELVNKSYECLEICN